ncbi:MAG: hypothetical protein OES32_03815 [Acidobacteriota bacterium]|nr:hypothetical protein [Acidobacteriota bacterium]MDH3522690.1 hypothetical protein [Acidobacteriota bacterium]
MSEDWPGSGLLGDVRDVVRGAPCHLVGGAVRDRLLGRAARDLDLVVAGDPGLVARLAERLPARRIELGGDRFAAVRLVGRRADGRSFVIDVWDRGAATLGDELARRDFTINAIAVDLADGVWHDPLGGRRDLETRTLRACSDAAFRDDPLRVLRLARLAAELPGFAVERQTLALAREAASGLPGLAAERRREEFVRTLAAPDPAAALVIWVETGFYPRVMAGRVEPRAALAAAATALDRSAAGQRELSPADEVDAFALHAAVALTAAEGDLATLAAAGYVSRAEARRTALVLPHRSLPTASRDQRWLLHRAAALWPAAILHAAAWDPAPARADVRARLRRCVELAHHRADAIFDPEPLLRGDEIRRLLDLAAGPEIGRLAKRLRRLQVEGALLDRRQAVAWLLSERRSSSADSAP